MKNKWRNYALKDGKIQSSYIREYCNRKKVRKTREASNCDSNEQSRKEQSKDEEEVKLVHRGPEHYRIGVNPIILNDAWVVNLRKQDESSREEKPSETYKEGRQGIQVSDQGRCETEERSNEIKDRKEKVNGKSKTRVRSPIQSSGEISSEIRCSKSSSSSGSSWNEKVRKRKDGKDGSSRKKESLSDPIE
jgi:hypothetical protein